MENIIRSLGAGSGIDTSALVSGLVEVERAPQQERLDTKKERLDAEISAYGTLKSSLSELQSILDPLQNNDTFNARSVSFPETNVITPNSVDPGAQTGTYQIEVLQVAQAQSLATGAFADKEAALNESGTLTISFGTWVYDEDATNGNPGLDADTDDDPFSFTANAERSALNITVETTDTLQDIADKINNQDAEVQASVLAVDGKFQLLLTAPSGANNAMRITSDDATKGDTAGLSIFEFNETESSQVSETQQGQNAQLKVNGLTVSREQNDINDVINGFDFTLNKTEPGTNFTFSVTEDTSLAEQAIRDFVTAYNTFYQTAQNLTGISRDENNQVITGDLSRDGTAKAIVNQIRSSISSLVPGVSDGFNALTNVGIRTELDGSLSIDEDDFRSAIDDNFQFVETLFALKAESNSSQVSVSVGAFANETAAGNYDVVVTTDPERAALTLGAIGGAKVNFADGPPDTVNFDASAAGNDFSFILAVDGTTSKKIALSGTYTSVEEVRADLQSLINGDENLRAANVSVDVAYDEVANTFSLTSRSYGAASTLTLDAVNFGADMAQLGFVDGSDTGVDVAGTIDGAAAFGSGNVLLPPIGSDPYGLNFTIGDNAVAAGTVTATFSRGFAGELTSLINTFLSTGGNIDSREESINDQLEGITEDREELDRKMERFEARLLAQYQAMERIISSFQSSGNQLTGLVDRLPFTASGS